METVLYIMIPAFVIWFTVVMPLAIYCRLKAIKREFKIKSIILTCPCQMKIKVFDEEQNPFLRTRNDLVICNTTNR